MKPAEPLLWGLIGAVAGVVLAIVAAWAGIPNNLASPAAGGFFMGWVAGLLWNWSGKAR